MVLYTVIVLPGRRIIVAERIRFFSGFNGSTAPDRITLVWFFPPFLIITFKGETFTCRVSDLIMLADMWNIHKSIKFTLKWNIMATYKFGRSEEKLYAIFSLFPTTVGNFRTAESNILGIVKEILFSLN